MNILPKKRWHVRTKENIARVRRDEENARLAEEERLRRVALAEQEARTEHLRQQAKKRTKNIAEKVEDLSGAVAIKEQSQHLNFFEDLEKGGLAGTNKEYEAEQKAEKEKYEKDIGLLTYLGQSQLEPTTSKPWWSKAPGKRTFVEASTDDTKDLKKKASMDPLRQMEKYLDKKHVVKKHKTKHDHKHKHKDSDHKAEKRKKLPSEKSIEQLRAERLAREKIERAKTEMLLAKRRGEKLPEEKEAERLEKETWRYNSQFNPDLVRRPTQKKSYY